MQRAKKKREEYPEQRRADLDQAQAERASFREEQPEQHRTMRDAKNETSNAKRARFREEQRYGHIVADVAWLLTLQNCGCFSYGWTLFNHPGVLATI